MLTLTHPTPTTIAPKPTGDTATITTKPAPSGTTLSVAQVLVLSTAAQRPDHMVLPLPTTLRLRGRGQTKLLTVLLEARLVEEVPVTDDALCWRRDADDQRIGLRVTAAGLTAIQAPSPTPLAAPAPESRVAPEPKVTRARKRQRSASAASTTGTLQNAPASTLTATPDLVPDPAPAAVPATTVAQPVHPGGKLGQVLSAVSAEAGATLAELVSLTGWQAHTARAALTGLRRRGFAVQLSEQQGRKAYRLEATG